LRLFPLKLLPCCARHALVEDQQTADEKQSSAEQRVDLRELHHNADGGNQQQRAFPSSPRSVRKTAGWRREA
ncbi:hypothetical protein ACC758_39715, partial [Rhizobium ruizarguesonis]